MRIKGLRLARVSGLSMMPTLVPGDYVIIDSFYPFDKVHLGQILVFISHENEFIIHRYIKRKERAVTTKGDGVLRNDPPLSDSAFFGVVVGLLIGKKVLSSKRIRWKIVMASCWIVNRIESILWHRMPRKYVPLLVKMLNMPKLLLAMLLRK